MTCADCGQPCEGQRCQMCQRADRAAEEYAAETDGGAVAVPEESDDSPEVPPPPEEVIDDARYQYQAMTQLDDDEYARLAADIRKNGVLQPVIVDDSPEQVIIDGHHREAIAQHYDLPEEKQPAYVVVGGAGDDEKLSRAIKQNLIGRDTTEGVKSHAVRQYIELSWDRTDDGDLIRPETDSDVAEKLGVDRSLVSQVVRNGNNPIIYHDRVKAREYYEENPDASYREVAENVDASRPTVTKWLKEDFDEGKEEKDDDQSTLAATTTNRDEAEKTADVFRRAQEERDENVREEAEANAEQLARGETSPDEAADAVEQTEKEVEEQEKKEKVANSVGKVVDETTFDVSQHEWWQLPRQNGDPHLIYCGDTATATFTGRLNDVDVEFAFADPPYNADAADWDSGFEWEHDYLSNIADVVAVTPGIESIKPFMRRTEMPYEWSVSAWIDNGMTRGALGFGNWIYIALFTELESIHCQSQDLARVSVRTSESDETDHKGRKPTELMEWLAERFVSDGGVVVDPFLGSGTTLLTVAEFTDARVIGGEIEPEFVSEILHRWEDHSGRVPEVVR